MASPINMPRELPDGVSREGLLLAEDGSGPLFHRTYTAAIASPDRAAADLIAHVGQDPNRVAPLALARFRRTRGAESPMEVGDEFLVRMPGPWDGPIRTVEVTPESFRFATLDVHLEAGQIEWRALDRDGSLIFQVEWPLGARGGRGDPPCRRLRLRRGLT